MKKIALILLLMGCYTINAQVFVGENRESKFPSSYSYDPNPFVIELSDSLRRNIAKRDSASTIQYFGKGFDTSVDIIKEGRVFYERDKKYIYYEIKCVNAFSINLIFNRIQLNKTAQLNIYNMNRTFKYGPVEVSNLSGPHL